MSRRTAALAWSCCAASLLLLAVGIAFTLADRARLPSDNVVGNIVFAVPIGAFAIVGGLIGARRPGNAIGRLCAAIGLLLALVIAGDGLSSWGEHTGQLPRAAIEWLGWLTAAWVPALGLMGTQLPLRLPDGRPLSGRWRAYGRFCLLVVALVSFVVFTDPSGDGNDLSNPTGLSFTASLQPLFLLLPLTFIGAIASVVVRYRRSGSYERHQLRWVAFGAVVFLASYVVALAALTVGGVDDSAPLGQALTSLIQLGYAAIPAGIGFAVLRRQLYDIDVVLNRALVYTALSATLAAAYAIAVLLLQLVLAPLTEGSGLAVAASTLAVAALFGPARARIQALVDRRFFRRRYDAARTLDEFSARLRDEVDLDSLSTHLHEAVRDTVQPTRVSLWLRP